MPRSLINTMKELVTIHEQLLEVTSRKKDVLIEGNIDALSKLIQEESKLVRSLGKLEEERMFQVKQFLDSKGLEAEGISLAQLLHLIPTTEDREALQKEAEKLQQTVEEIRKLNELNAKLIQDSLAYVNQTIELVTDTNSDQINYQSPIKGPGKTPTSTGGRSFFDTRA